MKRLVLAVAVLLSLSAQAADPERLREAQALFRAMHLQAQMDAMTNAMGKMMLQQVGPSSRNPHVGEVMMSEAMSVVKEQMLQPGGVVDSVAEAYADAFTLDELREIRAFYESPVGQKVLAEVPQMMPRVMSQSMARMKDAAPVICRRARDRLLAEGLQSDANSLKCQ